VATDSWLTDREQRSWRSFVGVQLRLFAHLQRQLQRESGLSAADYDVLVALSEAPGHQLRAFELGRITQWEKSRLSHHLSRMEQRGLVEKRKCESEPRYYELGLTDAGLAAIRDAAPRHAAQVRAAFVDVLTPEQLDQLGEACDAVLAKLDDRGVDPCDGPQETDGARETSGADDDGPC
jgi:DNA-binding MarR family transcriptional regulator